MVRLLRSVFSRPSFHKRSLSDPLCIVINIISGSQSLVFDPGGITCTVGHRVFTIVSTFSDGAQRLRRPPRVRSEPHSRDGPRGLAAADARNAFESGGSMKEADQPVNVYEQCKLTSMHRAGNSMSNHDGIMRFFR